MSFPIKVKEDALIASGRHCCLCHKFCGNKMELHHIQPVAEGGKNTFDNCIPLCFDCHADMRSYDFNHPKGTKYTNSELIRHRDNWYEKIKNNLGSGQIENLEQDIRMFKTIIALIPPSGTIDFIRMFHFANTFRLKNLEQFDIFISKLEQMPWLEFFDSDLEGLKSELYISIKKFRELVACNTFNIEGSHEIYRIPQHWEYEQRDKYNNLLDNIHGLTTRITDIYDNFIRLARKKLSVEV
jgi:hypothetical protein